MEINLTIVAIIQARMGSTRLPGKVLRHIGEKTILEILLDRVKKSVLVDKVLVATSNQEVDDKLAEFLVSINVDCYRGSEQDVLGRYYLAAKSISASTVVRLTADDPLKDPELIDQCIRQYIKGSYDYVSNNNPPTYPLGLDVEVISFSALQKSFFEATERYQREHVTPYIRENPLSFEVDNVKDSVDLSRYRLTIDYESDLKVVKALFKRFNFNYQIGYGELKERMMSGQLDDVFLAGSEESLKGSGRQ